MVRTKWWIKEGPQYMRFVLIKKDNRKWFIAKVEEISPTVWENDGAVQEAGNDEEEEEAPADE